MFRTVFPQAEGLMFGDLQLNGVDAGADRARIFQVEQCAPLCLSFQRAFNAA